jgi:uncharacterized alkaline shock family protein YloU
MNENKEYISQIQDNGSLHISEEVIASIAGLAVMEVEGVCGLGNSTSLELSEILGKKNLSKGIRISVSEENEVALDCTIMVKLGYNIKEVATAAQNAVASHVESVSGLRVSAVNVTVAGIALPKDGKR